MPLSSSSTDAEVEAAYDDNASYQEGGGNADQCRSFITACRMLLRRMPKMSGSRESTVTLNPELIQREKDDAEAWLASQGSTAAIGGVSSGGSVRVSFRNCRD